MNLNGIVRVVRGLVKSKIVDATSGLIANVDTKQNGRNGLQVISGNSPADFIFHDSVFLLNGSNKSMDVDGDPTPQVFSWTVPGGETWFMDGLSLFILDPGSMDFNDFGAIGGGLATGEGLLIEMVLNGTTYEFFNLTDNTEISHVFPKWGQPTESDGWLDEEDLFFGIRHFENNITLRAGDVVRATVRADLTPLTELTMAINKWRIIT